MGSRERPNSVPASSGIPDEVVELTVIVPFNDLGALEGVVREHSGQVAGVLMEPVMMNAGIIPPDPGYLEGVGNLTRRHGILLAFDEVKTGLTIAPGGATELFGVTPDIVCLAKSLGGGLPCGAIGGSNEVMGLIVDGAYEQVGTFNGNPLTMAAARAAVERVLNRSAYEHFDRLREMMVDGLTESIRTHDLPAYVQAIGPKGCVVFSRERVRDYRDFLRVDDRFSNCHWLFQHNGGVFLPPWGKAEQWMVSVQHTEGDIQRFLGNFERFAAALTA
jgi:glutamate-1-semialdehyde 2,1-aminomutase